MCIRDRKIIRNNENYQHIKITIKPSKIHAFHRFKDIDRWIERINGLQLFVTLFPSLWNTLNDMRAGISLSRNYQAKQDAFLKLLTILISLSIISWCIQCLMLH